MKKNLWIALPVLAALCTSASPARSQVRAALSFTEQGLDRFYLSIGEHYRVPQEKIVVVRQHRIPDEEVPVVFFIAREARVSPEKVVVLRKQGRSWRDIAIHLRLGPDVFFVKGVHATGPYARPYGYTNGKPDWRRVRFTDVDVVNCVNLRFLSERHGCSPDRIVGWRSQGRTFYDMDRDLRGPAHMTQDRRDGDRMAYRSGPGKSNDRGKSGWNHRDNGRKDVPPGRGDHRGR